MVNDGDLMIEIAASPKPVEEFAGALYSHPLTDRDLSVPIRRRGLI
jgi:hypothetical protein